MSKIIKSSGPIDSRKYEDIFLLSKILVNKDNIGLTSEEVSRIMIRFQKSEEKENNE